MNEAKLMEAIKDRLAVHGLLEEEKEGEQLEEGAEQVIFADLGRLQSDIVDIKQAINQENYENAAHFLVGLIDHAGKVATHFTIADRREGWLAASQSIKKDLYNFLKSYKIPMR